MHIGRSAGQHALHNIAVHPSLKFSGVRPPNSNDAILPLSSPIPFNRGPGVQSPGKILELKMLVREFQSILDIKKINTFRNEVILTVSCNCRWVIAL